MISSLELSPDPAAGHRAAVGAAAFAIPTGLCVMLAMALLAEIGECQPRPGLPVLRTQTVANLVTTGPEAPAVEPAPPMDAPADPITVVQPVTLLTAVPSPGMIAAEPPPPAPDPEPRIYQPLHVVSEALPATHPRIDPNEPVRVWVVTVRVKVTAYTAYDHLITKPEWADGVVAWHPGGRQRRVDAHPHGVATDWEQFPGGATFIRIPGYLDQSHPDFPHNFWVVDDKCGQSRKARRLGQQPIIDLRFVTLFSAIDPVHGWGARELDVEVIFPAGFDLPDSLRPWVVSAGWQTWHHGRRIDPAPGDTDGTVLAGQMAGDGGSIRL
jgi:hypothetical protein